MKINFIAIIALIFNCITACTPTERKENTALKTKQDTIIKPIHTIKTATIEKTKTDSLNKLTITFNPKFSSAQTPLTFTFTYKNKKYRFYACAYYLLPNKKAKEKNKKQLEILASIYDGLGSDDFNDGADLKIEVPLIEKSPLKIASGYFSVNNYKILDVIDGFLIITKSDKNIISGTFTINGKIVDKENGKLIEKFMITDGKFEKLPVTVHYISNFEDGWIDPSI